MGSESAKVLSLVPPFQGNEEIISRKQNTNQIVKEVIDAHYAFAGDYDLLVKGYAFKKHLSIEEQLFTFCKDNLHYNAESEKWQSTRSPAAIIELGSDAGVGVDCKHYAGYIAGCLDGVNRYNKEKTYDWFYRFASYDDNPAPGHVFVVVDYGGGEEVWIDPVLRKLDKRYPSPNFVLDKRLKDMSLVRISGLENRGNLPARYNQQTIGCACMGACKCGRRKLGSTSTTGATIMKLAPALSEVPVAALAVEVVGLALNLFGSKFNDSTQERWLIALYQFYVLGNLQNATDHTVSESYGPAAVTWFTTVLGVYMPDRAIFDALKGFQYGTTKSLNQTLDQRVKIYLAQPKIVPYQIPYAQAYAAAEITDTMPYNAILGSWRNFPPAPTLTLPPGAQLPANTPGYTPSSAPGGSNVPAPVSPTGNPNIFQQAGSWIQANPVPSVIGAVLLVGGIAYAVSRHKKRKKKSYS